MWLKQNTQFVEKGDQEKREKRKKKKRERTPDNQSESKGN